MVGQKLGNARPGVPVLVLGAGLAGLVAAHEVARQPGLQRCAALRNTRSRRRSLLDAARRR